ncbi:MAG: uncharacterized protein QOH79_3563 [Acidimicrobiaceae bacterium]|jgi:hypothetical protein
MRGELAARVDESSGVRDEVRFVGPPGDRLITVLSRALATPVGGTLVCSPMGNDFVRVYRHELRLGHALAARGWSTLRFHYRGTGNSDGVEADVDYDSLVGDVLAAGGAVQEHAGVGVDLLVGTRLSGLVAAAASGPLRASRLVLVDPPLDGRSYFREAWRAEKVQTITTDAASSDPAGELRDAGQTMVFGITVHRRLHDSVVHRRLEDEVTGERLQILWVQLVEHDTTKREAEILDAWAAAGHDVTVVRLPRPQAWWTPPEGRESIGEALSDTIATWAAGP